MNEIMLLWSVKIEARAFWGTGDVFLSVFQIGCDVPGSSGGWSGGEGT